MKLQSKRVIIVAIIFCIFFVSKKTLAFSYATNFSHIKTGIVNYASEWSTYLPLNIKEQVLNWQAHHFDIFADGADVTPYNPDVLWTLYKDNEIVYPTDLPSMKIFAEANGFTFEDLLIHMKVDYQISDSTLTWDKLAKGMDMFDVFEGSKGVFLLNGSTYIDKTDAAYNTTVADVPVSDKLLIGYGEPFAEANFVFSIVASGGVVVTWEYWNGSAWSVLPLASDGTNSFSQNGKVTFVPPSDWARKIENGSQNKWWIRAAVSGGTTNPIASRIYGDNWMPSGGTNNARGWDENDVNIINKGLGALEYNSNPPAGSTAKFRYQARLTGAWQPGVNVGNPADIQNGKRTFAAYISDWIIKNANGQNFKGTMFDDAEGSPKITSPANAIEQNSDFTDESAGKTYLEHKILQLQEQQATINASLPDFQIGKNTNNLQMSYASPWSLHEGIYLATNTGSLPFDDPSKPSFDDYLPVNNPNGTKAVMHIFDTYPDGKAASDGKWFFWDRGNRGPISSLASYYIAANDNTYFGYNSLGWSYWETDDFIYYDSHSTTLTQGLNVDSGTTTKNIYGADFSAFPASGTLQLKIGDSEPNLDVFTGFTKISSTQLQTTKPIYFSHNVGEKIQFAVRGHQVVDPIPKDGTVARWANSFPAVFVNVGVPDTNGYNGGNRNLSWLSGANLPWAEGADEFLQQNIDTANSIDVANDIINISGKKWGDRTAVRFISSDLPAPLAQNTTYYLTNTVDGSAKISLTDNDAYLASIGWTGRTIDLTATGSGTIKIYRVGQNVWRRDYTNAVILNRPAYYNSNAAEFNDYSVPIDLGGTYYPLKADGTTGLAVTQLSLRTGEGAILLKQPINNMTFADFKILFTDWMKKLHTSSDFNSDNIVNSKDLGIMMSKWN